MRQTNATNQQQQNISNNKATNVLFSVQSFPLPVTKKKNNNNKSTTLGTSAYWAN
jgi:hypothetical protein